MGQIGRPGLWDDQKVELWTLFKAGESFTEIARVLGKPVGSIDGVVRLRGGMVPRIRKRAYRALTRGDREAISRRRAAEESIRSLARTLDRAPSTIRRLVARFSGLEVGATIGHSTRTRERNRKPTVPNPVGWRPAPRGVPRSHRRWARTGHPHRSPAGS